MKAVGDPMPGFLRISRIEWIMPGEGRGIPHKAMGFIGIRNRHCLENGLKPAREGEGKDE